MVIQFLLQQTKLILIQQTTSREISSVIFNKVILNIMRTTFNNKDNLYKCEYKILDITFKYLVGEFFF